MMAGRPVVYSTFLAYDEVAHHSGIERHDTLAVLRQVDRQIARVQVGRSPTRRGPTSSSSSPTTASRRARPSPTATGITLEDARALGVRRRLRSRRHAGGEDEALAYLGAGLTEVAGDDTTAGRARALGHARAPRRRGGDARPARLAPRSSGADELPEIVVMASGCLGLVSFPREPGRVTLSGSPSCTRSCSPTLLRALRHRLRARALRAARRRRPRRRREPLPRRGAHRGRGPARALRPQRRRPRAPHRRLPALPRPAGQRRLLAPHRRGRRLRGARRLARRDGRQPVASLRPLPESRCASPTRRWSGAEHLHRVLRGWLVELGHDAYRDEAGSRAAGGADSPPASR